MRTFLSLSLAAFALAAPVAQPHLVARVDEVANDGEFCLDREALFTSLIDLP